MWGVLCWDTISMLCSKREIIGKWRLESMKPRKLKAFVLSSVKACIIEKVIERSGWLTFYIYSKVQLAHIP